MTPPKKSKKEIETYTHPEEQRPNNPPVGLVTPETDKDLAKKTYAYDPHLDPSLQWAGKAERLSFEVPTVSLHVHERIDPRTVIQAVTKKETKSRLPFKSFFDAPNENPPLREAVEFYKHPHNWSNRLIAGDSLLVMNSLLEKEGMAGKVQMIYIDPPYGIRYGSNFQPFVNKRDVKDGKDEDLNQEPETLKAFRDTWEVGIHSYLTFLRDRLLLARELLHESGSCFVQISDENVHHVRELMDEVFGNDNFCGMISFRKTGAFESVLLGRTSDYLLWYACNRSKVKYRGIYREKNPEEGTGAYYRWVEEPNVNRRPISGEERNDRSLIPLGSRFFLMSPLSSAGPSGNSFTFLFNGKEFSCDTNSHWKTTKNGLQKLADAGRLMAAANRLYYVRYLDDFPVSPYDNTWTDTVAGGYSGASIYVVQTSTKVIERCLLMTSDPGDLVFDPTCGSGTTAYVAEQWGRRWITCDTSRVALTLAKQRLMTASFDYYELARPDEGVSSGFQYKTVPHITLKSIANNPEIKEGMTREEIDRAIKKYADQETLYDQPYVDSKKVRVTGPFTVEAVPAPVVLSLDEAEQGEPVGVADASISRSGETLRQSEWRDELFRTGIRGKGGQRISFSRLELLPGTRWLHADGETKEDSPQRVVVSFGPDHAPLEKRQVELALNEAESLRPKPKLVVFAAFQFDPEATRDIDETNWPGVTLLKVQMNADLLTQDLKKKRASNESFWLIGQPDVSVERLSSGEYQVEVSGFDYYNTRTGNIESGGKDRIALWCLDTDYDGRSLFPRQVFFPMAGDGEGWSKLAKTLRAEIDLEKIEAFRGTVSLPFVPGEHKRIAVKIVDDRGIESFKVIGLA
uniref:site-specific DNA-methyltransferase (adenine-specific) n=1 Tax=Leptospirillum sp. Group II '5-way CG' TaxID=419541 RepID=B6AN43_9BACT|nr:MAG: putative type III restriction-modification system, methylation subunit [Leptospirillum sp. Group II '5-way CG']